MPRDFVPAADAEFDLWLANFSTQLAARGTGLGFTPAELTALSSMVAAWTSAFEVRRTSRDAARASTADKRDARRGVMSLVRPYARRIQAHPAVTDAVRSEMRLTTLASGTPPIENPAEQTPLLLLDFGTRGQITVHFGPNPGNENRNGLPARAIGAVVQARAQGGTTESSWEWVANPSSSPFVHLVQPAAPTLMEYRCAYLYRRGQRGPWSAVASAAVTP